MHHGHHDMNQSGSASASSCGMTGDHGAMVADYKKRFIISLILTIPIVLLSHVVQGIFHLHSLSFQGDIYISFLLSTIIFFYGGWPFLSGMVTELKDYNPGMMTLIAIAITVAYFYSVLVVFGLSGMIFFWELATLIDIMLLGHWIEMKSVMRAGDALEKLVQLMPAMAHKVLPNGEIIDVSRNTLAIDDKVLVKPGEKIPADGLIVEGASSVNESMLTGESQPVSKSVGASVIGGAINEEGALLIQVKKTGKDSFLSQVINLVKQAQESKSKTQDIANRAARWLTFVALASGAMTFVIWILFTAESVAFALERTVTVMVITCPHALGLAVPLVIAVSTALAARHGLLIRNRTAFETARSINAVIFDKTGTLTEGKFGITDILVFDKTLDQTQLLQYAAAVEARSEHPIAKAIASAGKLTQHVTEFKALPGKGAQAQVDGYFIQVVSYQHLQENDIPMNTQINQLLQTGKTLVFILKDKKLIGAIALADIIRPESFEAIKQLKLMGIQCLMLTGDNNQVAKNVAHELGLDDYFAEVLPHDKVNKVKEVQSRGYVVAMAGDGINDAPALAAADVGIAIGAGTDVAISTADIILVRSNPADVVSVITLARATTKKMIQNLFWATGYNAFAIPLAAGVLFRYGILLSPAVGAVLMSLSTVIVAINARLLRV